MDFRLLVHFIVYLSLVLVLAGIGKTYFGPMIVEYVSQFSLVENRLSEYRSFSPASESIYAWALALAPISILTLVGDGQFRRSILGAKVDNEGHTRIAAIVGLLALPYCWVVSLENASGDLTISTSVMLGIGIPISYHLVNFVISCCLVTLFGKGNGVD